MREMTSSYDDSKKEFGALFDEVSKILFRLDPMGVNLGENKDEYDREAAAVLPRLKECKSQRNARKVIHEEFTRFFEGLAGPVEVYNEVAKEIWEAWLRHEK